MIVFFFYNLTKPLIIYVIRYYVIGSGFLERHIAVAFFMYFCGAL